VLLGALLIKSLTAASDWSSSGRSGELSGASFSGISCFCEATLIFFAMNLHNRR
jgi:hypothetical protein